MRVNLHRPYCGALDAFPSPAPSPSAADGVVSSARVKGHLGWYKSSSICHFFCFLLLKTTAHHNTPDQKTRVSRTLQSDCLLIQIACVHWVSAWLNVCATYVNLTQYNQTVCSYKLVCVHWVSAWLNASLPRVNLTHVGSSRYQRNKPTSTVAAVYWRKLRKQGSS